MPKRKRAAADDEQVENDDGTKTDRSAMIKRARRFSSSAAAGKTLILAFFCVRISTFHAGQGRSVVGFADPLVSHVYGSTSSQLYATA